jgi:hypothetical protein
MNTTDLNFEELEKDQSINWSVFGELNNSIPMMCRQNYEKFADIFGHERAKLINSICDYLPDSLFRNLWIQQIRSEFSVNSNSSSNIHIKLSGLKEICLLKNVSELNVIYPDPKILPILSKWGEINNIKIKTTVNRKIQIDNIKIKMNKIGNHFYLLKFIMLIMKTLLINNLKSTSKIGLKRFDKILVNYYDNFVFNEETKSFISEYWTDLPRLVADDAENLLWLHISPEGFVHNVRKWRKHKERFDLGDQIQLIELLKTQDLFFLLLNLPKVAKSKKKIVKLLDGPFLQNTIISGVYSEQFKIQYRTVAVVQDLLYHRVFSRMSMKLKPEAKVIYIMENQVWEHLLLSNLSKRKIESVGYLRNRLSKDNFRFCKEESLTDKGMVLAPNIIVSSNENINDLSKIFGQNFKGYAIKNTKNEFYINPNLQSKKILVIGEYSEYYNRILLDFFEFVKNKSATHLFAFKPHPNRIASSVGDLIEICKEDNIQKASILYTGFLLVGVSSSYEYCKNTSKPLINLLDGRFITAPTKSLSVNNYHTQNFTDIINIAAKILSQPSLETKSTGSLRVNSQITTWKYVYPKLKS